MDPWFISKHEERAYYQVLSLCMWASLILGLHQLNMQGTISETGAIYTRLMRTSKTNYNCPFSKTHSISWAFWPFTLCTISVKFNYSHTDHLLTLFVLVAPKIHNMSDNSLQCRYKVTNDWIISTRVYAIKMNILEKTCLRLVFIALFIPAVATSCPGHNTLTRHLHLYAIIRWFSVISIFHIFTTRNTHLTYKYMF